jgi:hypothetical protein
MHGSPIGDVHGCCGGKYLPYLGKPVSIKQDMAVAGLSSFGYNPQTANAAREMVGSLPPGDGRLHLSLLRRTRQHRWNSD